MSENQHKALEKNMVQIGTTTSDSFNRQLNGKQNHLSRQPDTSIYFSTDQPVQKNLNYSWKRQKHTES